MPEIKVTFHIEGFYSKNSLEKKQRLNNLPLDITPIEQKENLLLSDTICD